MCYSKHAKATLNISLTRPVSLEDHETYLSPKSIGAFIHLTNIYWTCAIYWHYDKSQEGINGQMMLPHFNSTVDYYEIRRFVGTFLPLIWLCLCSGLNIWQDADDFVNMRVTQMGKQQEQNCCVIAAYAHWLEGDGGRRSWIKYGGNYGSLWGFS